LLYTLFCDDVRLEAGNKLSFMGVFQNIMVQQLPVSLIKFAVVRFRAITEAGQAKPEDEIDLRAKEIGDFTETWQGVDVNLNARLQNGLQLQFGTSTGRTGLNDCALTDQLPERDQDRAIGFCDRTEPYQTQLKGYAVYTIPTIDVQISGTFRSTPGDFVNANFNATNAYLAANSTLGRPLAGGASNITVELIEPNTVQLDRLNQLDLRFGKVFRIGGARSVVSLDLFNALNIDAVLNANQTFNADWLAPQSILDARVAKISLQFDW
jgi:hypothetical protein